MFWKKFVTAFSITILISASGVSAATTTSLEDATVNLYCRTKIGNRTFSTTGSGVFIHDSGVILTNAHVAQYFLLSTSTGSTKSDCSVRQGATAKEKYDAELLFLSPSWARNVIESTKKLQPRKGTGESDYALLRVTRAKRGKLPNSFSSLPSSLLSVPLKENDEVSVAGYPAEGLSFKNIQRKLTFKEAEAGVTSIQSYVKPYSDLLTLSATELSASGVSGGPVMRAGELIGIAVTVSENSDKDKRGLRAISLSYIDRAMRVETGFSLSNFIALANLLKINPTSEPYAELKKTIEKSFRNTRE